MMTTTASAECWFCNPEVREGDPPGGWIFTDVHWRVGHSGAGHGPAGTVVVEAKRHFLDVSEMTPEEAASFGPLLGRVVGAIKATVGATRVYVWSTMARFPHLHVVLIPWWEDSPNHGPAHLVQTFSSEGASEAAAARTADELRSRLARAEQDSGTADRTSQA